MKNLPQYLSLVKGSTWAELKNLMVWSGWAQVASWVSNTAPEPHCQHRHGSSRSGSFRQGGGRTRWARDTTAPGRGLEQGTAGTGSLGHVVTFALQKEVEIVPQLRGGVEGAGAGRCLPLVPRSFLASGQMKMQFFPANHGQNGIIYYLPNTKMAAVNWLTG